MLLPVTTLLRAIGYEQDKDILQIFEWEGLFFVLMNLRYSSYSRM